MAKPKLTLYLDVVSPFAYLAFYITKNSAAFKQCDVTYVPVLLGGIMKEVGNRPPLEIKNKDKWIALERKRWQKAFNVPMSENGPKPFPQPTINAQRALCAIEMSHPDKLADAFGALYQAFWVEDKTINKPEVFGPALETVFGEAETKKILERIGAADVKKRLSENSATAIEKGCFGLPWFIATNAKGEEERFWGVDHMAQLAEHLGLDRKQEEGFRSLL